jgi:hypothetical protein
MRFERTRHFALRIPALLLASLAGGACTSYSHLRYDPVVQETELRGEANDVQARVAATWREVDEDGDVVSIRFRIRIDNPGPTLFSLVPATCELLDAELNTLALAEPEGLPDALEPGTGAGIVVVFLLRDDDALAEADLSTLTLRTGLQGQRWSWSSVYPQAVRASDHGSSGSAWNFGFGATFVF